MRLITRTLVFAIVILGAFWFTAENARELVTIDLAFLRVRASLPLVVFGSILAGMGLSLFIGWRAERHAEGRRSGGRPRLLRDREPVEAAGGDLGPIPRSAERHDSDADFHRRDEREPLEWR